MVPPEPRSPGQGRLPRGGYLAARLKVAGLTLITGIDPMTAGLSDDKLAEQRRVLQPDMAGTTTITRSIHDVERV
jgi:anaerobic magnesium-protoporphyrin IX monomethyl ester cyclase